MKKKQFTYIFFRKIQNIKRFLTSKDLFIFLFFLILSTSLWSLHALRKTYETVIQIPIKYTDLPQGFVQSEKLQERLRVTITDRGSALLNYRLGKRFFPIPVNMEDYINGKQEIITKTLEPLIQKQLNTGTQIIKITPDTLRFKFVRLKAKRLPVKLEKHIELAQQYTLCDSIEISPNEIKVFAPENILDTMRFVLTEPLELINLKDTIKQEIKLKQTSDISFSVPSVFVTIKSEPYTEKTVEVPIIPINFPSNQVLRTFPSVAKINFQIGLSQYNIINASSFSLSADYNDILKTGSKKIPVRIHKQPNQAFNIKISPQSVDYLIEETESIW